MRSDSASGGGPAQRQAEAGCAAVISISRAGSRLAFRIAAALPRSVAYVPQRFIRDCDAQPGFAAAPAREGYEGHAAGVVEAAFRRHAALVLVMAAGVAVRLIAPHLRDKAIDPAVVVVDDAGRFAISLIGGHAAGANGLAEQIARAIDATPVLTTATEPAGAPPIEELARQRGWRLEEGSGLTAVLAALVNGDRVAVLQDAGARDWLLSPPGGVELFDTAEGLIAGRPGAALIVTDRLINLPPPLAAHAAVYRPPVLALGIGCSRGADSVEIGALVDETLRSARLSPLAVGAVATIDRRRDEPGLRAFLAERGWPLIVHPAELLAAVPGEWSSSAAVQRAVGTPAVAEPAALAAASVRRLLVRKVKSAHVTLAIARSPVEMVAPKEAMA